MKFIKTFSLIVCEIECMTMFGFLFSSLLKTSMIYSLALSALFYSSSFWVFFFFLVYLSYTFSGMSYYSIVMKNIEGY